MVVRASLLLDVLDDSTQVGDGLVAIAYSSLLEEVRLTTLRLILSPYSDIC